MKRTVLAILAMVFLSFLTKAQTIPLGKSAEEVAGMLKFQVSSYYQARGNKTMQLSTNTKYANGQPVEVRLNVQNSYNIQLRKAVNFCDRYIVKAGKVVFLLSQYENISVKELEDLYNEISAETKVGNLYFTEDFQHFRKIYLSSNGLATIEYRKTELKALPIATQKVINEKLKDYRSKQEKAEAAEARLVEEENEQLAKEEAEKASSERRKEEILLPEDIETEAVVNRSPAFPGGESELAKFLKTNISYPSTAITEETNGRRIIVQFTVKATGEIRNIKIVKPLTEELENSVLQAVMKMPKWSPAAVNGKPVNFNTSVTVKLPVE